MAAAASSSTAVREGEVSADSDHYLMDDGDLRLVKKRNPNQANSSRAELDPDLWSRLNDSLKEQIIARLPLKALFRVASLSKTWSLAFRSPSFQREVLRSSSASWASYSPLLLNEKQQLLGFDGNSQLWHRLPTRMEESEAAGRTWRLESSGGSLLCWSGPYVEADGYQLHIHVSNPLNGSWKQLPSTPETGQCYPICHVVCQQNDAYQVILISFDSNHLWSPPLGKGTIFMHIFDSSSESWTISSHENHGLQIGYRGSVLLNGVIYVLVGIVSEIVNKLVSFHLRDRTWNVVDVVGENYDYEQRSSQHSRLTGHRILEKQLNGVELGDFHAMQNSHLVLCGLDIMLVAQDYVDDESIEESIALFKVDSEQGLAYRLATAPREMLTIGKVHCVVGYGDCLCVFGRYPSSLSIRYNVKTHEWNWASVVPDSLGPAVDSTSASLCIHSNYQPGWNPFLEV